MLDSVTKSRAAPGDLQVSEVRDAGEFERLRDEWNALVEADPRATFFQTWEFQYHTWRIFAEDVRPCLVLVRGSLGELIGCAPLGTSVWRLGPLSVDVLGFCSPRHCDYSSFIVHGGRVDDVLAALASWFRANVGRWHVAELEPVREDSWVMSEEAFLRKTGDRYRLVQRNTAPYLKLEPDWSTYEDALTKKRAGQMRYKVRKLFRRFDGEFRSSNENLGLEGATDRFFDLHQARMKDKHQRGHFGEDRAREEFQSLIKGLAQRGIAKLHTIGSGEQTIAAISTFEFRGSIAYFQSGFDPEYGKLSPGQVIHALRISEGLRDGASEYDFLYGDEPYKYYWANRERRIFRVELYTGSWRRLLRRWVVDLRRRLSQSARLRSLYLWLDKRRS